MNGKFSTAEDSTLQRAKTTSFLFPVTVYLINPISFYPVALGRVYKHVKSDISTGSFTGDHLFHTSEILDYLVRKDFVFLTIRNSTYVCVKTESKAPKLIFIDLYTHHRPIQAAWHKDQLSLPNTASWQSQLHRSAARSMWHSSRFAVAHN